MIITDPEFPPQQTCNEPCMSSLTSLSMICVCVNSFKVDTLAPSRSHIHGASSSQPSTRKCFCCVGIRLCIAKATSSIPLLCYYRASALSALEPTARRTTVSVRLASTSDELFSTSRCSFSPRCPTARRLNRGRRSLWWRASHGGSTGGSLVWGSSGSTISTDAL